MISPELEHHEKLLSEDDMVDNERTLLQLLNKLRHQYRNTIMTGEGDRIGFESLLKEVELYFNLAETQCNHTIDILRAENTIVTKDREIKIKEWKDRYDKIQYRWNDLTEQLTTLQKDKEEIRIQRDQLLTTHKQKNKLLKEEKSWNSTTDRRNTFEKTLSDLLVGIAEALQADRATVFLYSAPSDELRSIALYPVPKQEEDDEDVLNVLEPEEDEPVATIPKEIRIPASKGVAGSVFQTGTPENIENAYGDKRFFQAVDTRTGYRTKLILAYPIFSVRADAIIGVLQIINKKTGEGSFGIQDEARCTEFASFMSYIFASVHDLYDFLPKDIALTLNDAPIRRIKEKSINQREDVSNDRLLADLGKPQQSNSPYSNGIIPKDLDDYIKKVRTMLEKSSR